MGLDLTAYSAMAALPNHGPERGDCATAVGGDAQDSCREAGHNRVWCYAGFERWALAGMGDLGPVLGWDGRVVGIGVGWYGPTDATATLGWPGGSYSGHGEFRDLLAQLAGAPTASAVWASTDPDRRHLPFYELVNFADNEGVLGTDACTALAADFTAHRPAFELMVGASRPIEQGWLMSLYDDWTRGLEVAASDGFVVFH